MCCRSSEGCDKVNESHVSTNGGVIVHQPAKKRRLTERSGSRSSVGGSSTQSFEESSNSSQPDVYHANTYYRNTSCALESVDNDVHNINIGMKSSMQDDHKFGNQATTHSGHHATNFIDANQCAAKVASSMRDCYSHCDFASLIQSIGEQETINYRPYLDYLRHSQSEDNHSPANHLLDSLQVKQEQREYLPTHLEFPEYPSAHVELTTLKPESVHISSNYTANVFIRNLHSDNLFADYTGLDVRDDRVSPPQHQHPLPRTIPAASHVANVPSQLFQYF